MNKVNILKQEMTGNVSMAEAIEVNKFSAASGSVSLM